MIKCFIKRGYKQRQFSAGVIVLLSILLGPLPQSDAVDICIIGAGPAGIQAAYAAEAKGYTVAVFEKESYIGGRTKTVDVGDGAPKPYMMGAVLHVGWKSSTLKDLFLRFQVADLMLDYEIAFVKKDGSSAKFLPPLMQFVFQSVRLLTLRTKLGKYINGPEGYLSDYPASLNKPMKDWFEENNLNVLLDFYWFLMTTFGYGSLNEVPTVLGLKYLTTTSIIDALFWLLEKPSKWDFYVFQELLQKMADSLTGDVYLDSEIMNVDYEAPGGGSKITFSVNGNPVSTMSCGATIITFPPTTAAMGKFIPPASNGLEEIVDQVQTYNYFTLLFDDPEGDLADGVRGTLLLPQPDIPSNPGANLVYFKQQDFKGSAVVAYYLAPLGSSITDEQVLEESMTSYSSVIGRPVDQSFVLDFNRWTSFPHPSSESVDNGFFEKFQSLQGHKNQYYAGGTFNFDTVQDSMEHAEYLINKFF